MFCQSLRTRFVKPGKGGFIRGGNFEALKTPLPRYAVKASVSYIDPPYGTGTEHAWGTGKEAGEVELLHEKPKEMRPPDLVAAGSPECRALYSRRARGPIILIQTSLIQNRDVRKWRISAEICSIRANFRVSKTPLNITATCGLTTKRCIFLPLAAPASRQFLLLLNDIADA